MSLEHPLALVLLAVPAVLLWLRARAARPRDAEASSLLVWQRVSPVDTVPERPQPPLAAWIEAAGAALLVLGMAGPRGPAGEGPATVRVLLDTSASMSAKRPDGRTRIETARAIVAEYHTAVHVEVRESEDPASELAIWTAGGPPVVVVTDRRLPNHGDDPPRLRVVGLGDRGFNAGITAISGVPLADGKWRLFLAIEAHGGGSVAGGTLRIDGKETAITLTPGRPLEVVREVPKGEFLAGLDFPGDVLAKDDIASVSPFGGARVVLDRDPDPRLDALARALLAAGAEGGRVRSGPPGLYLRRSGPDAFDLAPQGEVDLSIPAAADGADAMGREVVSTGEELVKDVRIDPSVTMGRRGDGGPSSARVLLSDGEGPLAWLADRPGGVSVRFGFVPGGSWVERDPSFVVFARNVVEYAALGPPRLIAEAVQNPRETREAAEGETFGDLRLAIEEASRPDPASRVSYAFALLLAGAAALAAAWLAMR